jgi:hypothetical protein
VWFEEAGVVLGQTSNRVEGSGSYCVPTGCLFNAFFPDYVGMRNVYGLYPYWREYRLPQTLPRLDDHDIDAEMAPSIRHCDEGMTVRGTSYRKFDC